MATIDASTRLLSQQRLERLASAFELAPSEVLADAPLIMDWSGSSADLFQCLNMRHGWDTDESFYFVRWLRLHVWCSAPRLPG